MFLDLDGFKVVNDQHGHLVGDEVLVEVARRLRALTRVGDAYRWAGDEFCVTVDHADRDALDEVARRIADAFELGFAVDAGGTMLVRVGASLGKAIARPGDTVDDLVARADRHMYRGKGPGAGRRTERSSGPAHPRHGEASGEAVGADGE